MPDHEFWMQKAIKQAEYAQQKNEVPVGSIIVKNDKVIGTGFNQVINKNDATAHAEIQAIRNAGEKVNNYRIIDSTIYVTLEPCMMCVGAIIHSRINAIVFGAFDQKTGVAGTCENCFDKPYHNHQVAIYGGVLEPACAQLLKDFFKSKRKNKNQ